MFFFLSKLLDVGLSPLTWGLALLALAIPWRRARSARRRARSWRRRRALGAAGLLLLLAFSTEPVSNAMFRRLEQGSVSTYRPDVVYDAVILLGGVTDDRVTAETGQPSYNENVERLTATHRLLADGKARFAIVSGAATTPALVPYGEARLLAQQLVAWGISPSRVLLEEDARNTRENAVFSRRIALEHGFTTLLVVTSAFHMPRSIECFAAVDLPVDTLAVDYRTHAFSLPGPALLLPRTSSLSQSSQAFRELFGLWVYRAQGYARAKR